MSYRVVHRPARWTQPLKLDDVHELERAPVIEQNGGKANLLTLVPLLGAATSMTVMMLFRGSPFAAVGALMMIVTVLASVVLLFTQRGKARREREHKRDAYLEYLDDNRRRYREDDERLKREARINAPAFDALPTLVSDPARLWERRRTHSDFLRVRLGTGERRVRTIGMRKEESAIERPDFFLESEAESVCSRYQSCPGLPCDFAFDSRGEMTVVGPEDLAHSLVRELICRAACSHSPEDLEIAVVVPPASSSQWAWVALLPHVVDQERPSPIGPLRRIYDSRDALAADLRQSLIRRSRRVAEARKNSRDSDIGELLPRLLVLDLTREGAAAVLTSPDSSLSPRQLGVTCVRVVDDRLHEPDEIAARFTVSAPEDAADELGFSVLHEEVGHADAVRSTQTFRAERVTSAEAQALARTLAPLRLSPDSLEHNDVADSTRYTEMLGLRELSDQEITTNWQPRSEQDFLRVPLGPDGDGNPVLLDLKESAQLGMGPHGLCVGATGSGKSELLRTFVLALLTTHPPERLNMVLVDFKGGATFAPFEGVPHVNGIITNLAEDPSLIDRVHDSLAGEIRRRQEVLKAAGNIANITDYELHRREAERRGEQWAPLPHLLVIIDEFGELLTAQPDFIDLFLSIGRIGRSIGVHLMLSSQRIESGKLRGLETYLSYRLGLRTLSEAESRTVLDTADAFNLPAIPGYGYLKVDTTVYERFKAGFVSGPLANATMQDEETPVRSEPRIHAAPYFLGEQQEIVAAADVEEHPDEENEPVASERTTGTTVMGHLVDVLREFPRATQEIWLPPLAAHLPLDAVTGPLETTVAGVVAPIGGNLSIPVGMLDDPSRQWQDVWYVDLKRAGGNISILGGPQTGKTTALRTLTLAAALTHTPSELAFYGIDLKGSGLLTLESLPHVGGIGVRTVRENVRRTVEEVHSMLVHRENIFQQYGIDSVESMRALHRDGKLPELPVADIVLLIDGYGQLADEFEEIETLVHELLARGSGYGVHVVATATRSNEIRISQQSFFGNRIEFRLTEPAESSFGKKKGESLPTNRPGRAMQIDELIGHFALPRFDGVAGTNGLADAFADIAARITAQHPDDHAPAVRVLPPQLSFDDVTPVPREGMVALGLQEHDFAPQYVNFFGRDRHMLVMGDSRSGKTNLLRSICRQLVEASTPDDLVIALFDPRQELDGAVPEAYLGGHAKSPMLSRNLAAAIQKELVTRVPSDPTSSGPAQTPTPRIVLVIDDYDVLTAGGTSPLGELAPFASMAREVGLHVVMTRKVAGASRGMYEAFTAAVRESGAATFLMDGDRTEGALVNGIRPRHFPPGRGLYIQGGRAPHIVQAAYDPSLDPQEDELE